MFVYVCVHTYSAHNMYNALHKKIGKQKKRYKLKLLSLHVDQNNKRNDHLYCRCLSQQITAK